MAQSPRMHALVAALTAVLSGPAQAQAPDPVFRQLADLHALLLDPSRMFSISRSLAELEAIQPQTAPDSRERGEVLFLRGLVEQKAERPGPSVKSSIEALRIDDATPFLSPHERLMTNDRVASQAKDEGDCRTAIPYYQRALPLAAAEPALSDSQRLALRGDLGYCLHEAKRYAEARAVNQALLDDAVRAFGPGDKRLLRTLVNLAQNDYELHDREAARADLERMLALATTLHDGGHVDTALFQLGVLAYEGGKADEARDLMRRRLSLAEASGDAARIRAARRDLDELERKLAG